MYKRQARRARQPHDRRAAAAAVRAAEAVDPARAPAVVRDLLEHLAARKCVDAGDAAFLRAACGLFADRAARAAPGRRPVLARDEEHAAAQCFYDLIGAKVLRDACAGHVVSEAARKRRAKHFEARDGFALFAAPLVLRDRTAADEPPPPLVGRRDLLETLNGAAGAAARLARRAGDDDDVDAYLFAQKDAPQHWPGALLAGVYEESPPEDDDASVTAPDDDAAAAAADDYVAEIMARRLMGRDKEAAQEEAKAPAKREAALLDAAAWCARACACRPRDARRWLALARCYEDLAAPLLALSDLETPFAAAPPKRPLKAVARLPYAASTDVDLAADDAPLEEAVTAALLESVDAGCEGLMLKRLDAPYEYSLGSKRSDAWVKLKKDYVDALGDSLDLVVIGGWQGQGRKSKWVSPILVATRDPETEVLGSVCRVMSGFTDVFYKDFTVRALGAEIGADAPAGDEAVLLLSLIHI